MTEELPYRRPLKKQESIIKSNKPTERWSLITYYKTVTPCFISNHGRVIYVNSVGMFKEKQTSIKNGRLVVSFKMVSKYGNSDNQPIPVARLVLQHFIGGYRSHRKYIHLDGDTKNCHFTNLRWRSGFIDGVDYDYLRSLKLNLLNDDDKIIVKSLLQEDRKEIISLLYSKQNMIRAFDFKYEIKYLHKNDFSDFGIITYEKILNGSYKPVEGSINNPQSFNSYLFSAYKYESIVAKHERKEYSGYECDHIDKLQYENPEIIYGTKSKREISTKIHTHYSYLELRGSGRPSGISDELKLIAPKVVELHKNTSFSIKEIQKECDISQNSVYRCFKYMKYDYKKRKQSKNGRPKGITKKLKLIAEKAVNLHKNTNYDIQEIAVKCGVSQGSIYKCFKFLKYDYKSNHRNKGNKNAKKKTFEKAA